MVALKDYAKIKNNYCICYFGPCDEYLLQLKLVRPMLENSLSGLQIYIGCNDDKTHLIGDRFITLQQLRSRKDEFAHIREIKFDKLHPVEELLEEASIKIPVISMEANQKTNKVVIVSQSNYPTKCLEEKDIAYLKNMFREYDVELNADIQDAGIVAGVESLKLFEAASKGIKSYLIPSGLGTQLYKGFFPNGVVLHR